MFYLIQYKNGCLAVSDLFHIFTQSIHSITHIRVYRCLKKVIHQVESKNELFLLSASFTVKFRGFILKPTERSNILLKNGNRDFQNSPPCERLACDKSSV